MVLPCTEIRKLRETQGSWSENHILRDQPRGVLVFQNTGCVDSLKPYDTKHLIFNDSEDVQVRKFWYLTHLYEFQFM